MQDYDRDICSCINEVLEWYKEDKSMPYVSGLINIPRGRERLVKHITYMMFEQCMTDIDAILGLVQHEHDWPQE